MTENNRAITVSAVKKARRWPGSYQVSLSEGKAFICPDEVLVRWQLSTGKEIGAGLLPQLLVEAAAVLAKHEAARLLARGEKSGAELLSALIRKGIEATAAREAVQYMVKMGYINDEVYARNLVARLKQRSGFGAAAVYEQLLRKGVERALAKEAVERGFTEEDERRIAWQMVKKRLRQSRRSHSNQEQLSSREQLSGRELQQLAAYLYRRGMESATIEWCLERLKKEETDAFSAGPDDDDIYGHGNGNGADLGDDGDGRYIDSGTQDR